jgi:hypothetical protein
MQPLYSRRSFQAPEEKETRENLGDRLILSTMVVFNPNYPVPKMDHQYTQVALLGAACWLGQVASKTFDRGFLFCFIVTKDNLSDILNVRSMALATTSRSIQVPRCSRLASS